ncbi:hypothetical protein AGABI2DRAFT_141470 [Agaricus bisporus var. bisporus H97]|uniref:hypothetical protein n=1 Tax=Agaricus bisporus var. bisporus (strain H97 / ATCC MYA-4626 / FGSC 10389) TaxID=936046 RepID=UPI00029F7845|nr:hypothetical protein AGABI2DRAFT_141470 [Agaricus bisporus var. bisporus H97]EKV50666.1 hypothetical protein AGABI2DRAFT_141470 [Agaricus bisporus var. bisporus H97]
MTMHPELEEAFNMGLSMPEVFELFTKHHSGPEEERIDIGSCNIPDKLVHTDGAFWDDWRPSSYPPYRRILARELVDNPGIIELSTHTRFRKLIHEPWKALRESHPQYITTPPVLVLFLSKLEFIKWDEELLRSIYEFGSSQHSSPLLWIISSDTNLKLAVQDLLHPFPPFRYFRLPISYKEGPADTALILHHRFSAFRDKHKNMFDEEEVWPSEKQMSRLIMIVSGVVKFVEVIIHFIDWEDGGGPKSHLETFLAYMIDSPSPSDERPCCALDHFYMRALSDIPPDLLSVFKQVSSIIRPEYFGRRFEGSFELMLALLLSLGKDVLLNVLPHVYRLIWDRASGRNNQEFGDFLKDPMRSRQFYAPQSESYLCLYQTFLHILRHASNPIAMLKPMLQETQASAKSYWLTFDDLRHLETVNEPNIFRVRPDFKSTGLPLNHSEAQAQEWIRLHATRPKYVLLGSGSETVLAVLATRESYGNLYSGVNIYTSAMLDYMQAVRTLEASDIPSSEGTFVEENSANENR